MLQPAHGPRFLNRISRHAVLPPGPLPTPLTPGPLQNFLGGQDEEHFRLVHVDIEAQAAPAVAGLQAMQHAAEQVRQGQEVWGFKNLVGFLETWAGLLWRLDVAA
eukprot:366050-Chlamydomonas_euryale.AAC.15